MRLSRPIGYVSVVFALTMLGSVACGPASQPQTTPAAQPAASVPSTDQAPSGQMPAPVGMKRGGTYRYSQNGDPPTFDVHATDLSLLTNHTRATHNKLLRYEYGKERGGLVAVPDLAEKWEVSKDAKTWTFTLRKSVKFHNVPPVNGRELVADDVKFSYERLMSDKPGFWSGHYSFIDKIEVVDKYTIRFQLKEPSASAVYRFADGEAAFIVAKEVTERPDYGKEPKTSLIGTGPFLVSEHDRGVGIRHKRNPDYFGTGVAGTPYIDVVDSVIINDAGARLAAFLSKQIENTGVSPQDLEKVKAAIPGVQIIENTGSGTCTCLLINVRKPPFDNVKVRQAVKHGIDQQKIINDLRRGFAKWQGVIPSGLASWSLPQDELKQLYKYDPELSKRLLAEAGHPNGFKTEVMAFTQYSQDAIDLTEVIAADLKKIGIDMTIRLEPVTAGRKAQFEGNFVSNVFPHVTGVEPDEFLDTFLPGSAANVFGLNDSVINDLYKKQTVLTDAKERKQVVDQISRRLAEIVPSIPLPSSSSYSAGQPYLKNWFPDNIASDEPIETFIWLDK